MEPLAYGANALLWWAAPSGSLWAQRFPLGHQGWAVWGRAVGRCGGSLAPRGAGLASWWLRRGQRVRRRAGQQPLHNPTPTRTLGGLASSLGLHLTLGGRDRKGILQNPGVFWVEPQGEGLSAPFPPEQALLRGGHSCRNILTPGQAVGKPRSLLASSPVKSLSQPPGHREAKRAGKGERVCKEQRSCQLPRSEGAGTTLQAQPGARPPCGRGGGNGSGHHLLGAWLWAPHCAQWPPITCTRAPRHLTSLRGLGFLCSEM